ncbi:MAG: Mov34/MPN/PAD-1 family protein [Vicinamibacteria bacterium]|jgi:proteasome lid subunit RPN8/RPN11
MQISAEMLAELIAQARDEAPNECCGMIAARDGRFTAHFRARNEFESPMRFQIDSRDQIRISNEIESRGDEIGAIYHSHPNSEATPSQTDVNLARWWPGVVWVICSLAGEEPVVRAFRIDGTEVEEVELVVG